MGGEAGQSCGDPCSRFVRGARWCAVSVATSTLTSSASARALVPALMVPQLPHGARAVSLEWTALRDKARA